MPRIPRKQSSTNVYHVMIRGNNRQNIFMDNMDRMTFLKYLAECKAKFGFKIYAYCLMTNHVHLLIRAESSTLGLIFRRIDSRYAMWINKKYDRVGHVFQDRFKSENVENERYFLTVLRYIIQNPAKAGLEKQPGSYPWTSFREYEGGPGTLTDTSLAIKIAGSQKTLARYLQTPVREKVMDMNESVQHISDEAAKSIISLIADHLSIEDFKNADKIVRRKSIVEMLDAGLDIRQIVRLTGISRATVYRCANQFELTSQP
ncbi:MAG: transposase [Lachnospiraceae bacterium]|nr:transposase [Lachnospiraceae bacterium]